MLKNKFILFLLSFLIFNFSLVFHCYSKEQKEKCDCFYTTVYSFYCIEGSKECDDFVKLLKEYFLKDLGMSCWDKIPFIYDASGAESYQEYNQGIFNYLTRLLRDYKPDIAFSDSSCGLNTTLITCYKNKTIEMKWTMLPRKVFFDYFYTYDSDKYEYSDPKRYYDGGWNVTNEYFLKINFFGKEEILEGLYKKVKESDLLFDSHSLHTVLRCRTYKYKNKDILEKSNKAYMEVKSKCNPSIK